MNKTVCALTGLRFLRNFVAAGTLTLLPSIGFADTLPWQPGWDKFNEPLDYENSDVYWSLSKGRGILKIIYTLQGATPTKLYQLGIHLSCYAGFYPNFGQFPGTVCRADTRQGTTAAVEAIELGAVLTDSFGNATFDITVGPLDGGTYDFQFDVRNGAGCNVSGGGKQSEGVCDVVFQAPAPFGSFITITVKGHSKRDRD